MQQLLLNFLALEASLKICCHLLNYLHFLYYNILQQFIIIKAIVFIIIKLVIFFNYHHRYLKIRKLDLIQATFEINNSFFNH